MSTSVVELIGYLASALIVVSLAMTSVVRLRIISFIGSVTFVVYGLLIGAWPIVVSNAIIAGINVWYLRKELTRTDLGASPVAAQAPFLADFLESHAADIRTSQPGFTGVPAGSTAWLLTREGLPAGALVGRVDGSTLHVDLDYVMKAYRDSRLGAWIYGPGSGVLKDAGVRRVEQVAQTPGHRHYLDAMGFRPSGSNEAFALDLP